MEALYEDVRRKIMEELWRLSPQEFQDAAHWDLKFDTNMQDIRDAVDDAIRHQRCSGCGLFTGPFTDAYRTCGECGHAWQTREAWEAACREWCGPGDKPNYDSSTCQCCTHDL